MIIAKVRDRDIKLTPLEPVTSGSVGLQVKWEFDEHWRDLVKTAVFKGSGDARDVAIVHISGEDKDVEFCFVPKDVLKEAGGPLEIGVYGRTSNGAIVKPTIWGRINFIRLGVELSEADPSEPEPDWTAQVQQIAEEALEKANEVEERANNGEFDGADGEDGFSPTVEVEEVEGAAASGILLEDDAGGKWLLEDGGGADGNIVLADESGKLYQIPAGSAADGEVAVTDDSGHTWHIPINEAARNGHKITVTDKDGEHVFYVWDGRDGSDGKDGAKGDKGVTYTPVVDANGVISWTNDGNLPNPQPRNITGPQGERGPQGVQGEKGDAFTYEDFTPAQLEALRGPQGAQGATGPKGDKGDKGDTGEAGPQGQPGQNGAPGTPGAPGEDGKSAYESAAEGGYSGTESQFNADLAGLGTQAQEIADIKTKIPAAASSVNKLMDAAAVDAKIAAAIAGVTGFSYEVVQALPATGEAGVIYLLAHTGGTAPNVYDEYIWIGSGYEKLGTTEINLTGYATEAWVQQQGYLTEHQSLSAYRTATDQNTIDAGKQSKITSSGILKGDGNGGVSAATAGTDYATPSQINAKYTKPSTGIPDSDIASSSTWNGKAASTSVPASASVNASTGVISFKNSSGTQLFTVTLPKYNGEVV